MVVCTSQLQPKVLGFVWCTLSHSLFQKQWTTNLTVSQKELLPGARTIYLFQHGGPLKPRNCSMLSGILLPPHFWSVELDLQFVHVAWRSESEV